MLKHLVPRPLRRVLRSFVNDFEWQHPAAWSLLGRAKVLVGIRPSLGVSHLNNYLEETALGPLQQTEALLLFAAVRVLQPKMVVEFGFNKGDSALNFLRALPRQSVLHSYDIKDSSRTIAASLASRFANFHFHHKSQTEFAAGDVGNQPVDFVFLDAAHDLDLNQRTWQRLEPVLAESALVAIHDTGAWSRPHMLSEHKAFIDANPRPWLNDSEYLHQVEERQFVNWVLETAPAFSAVHFHSTNVLRHGLTFLQRGAKLSVGLPTAATSFKEAAVATP